MPEIDKSEYYVRNPWWEGKSYEYGIIRPYYTNRLANSTERKDIEVLIGGRRVGKTTLLRQILHRLIEGGIPVERIIYLAMDSPQFSTLPVADHLEWFRANFRHPRNTKVYLFIDEVQESSGWESQVKTIYEFENVKIFLTGSTSALLEKEGGKLTGRKIVTTVKPLSFDEFLSFRGERPSISESYLLEELVDEYLNLGGYPEQVLHPSRERMENMLDDLLARDIVRLYPVRKPDILKPLLQLVAASVGSRTSPARLARVLEVDNDLIKQYLAYFEKAFLITTLTQWTTSYTHRIYAPKKVYFLDTGMKTLLTGEGDAGFKAEIVVLNELLKRVSPDEQLGYFGGKKKETDFIRGTPDHPEAVEVKYATGLTWDDKKLLGVKTFLGEHPNCRRVSIITRDVSQTFKEGKAEIRFVPLWEFLLE